MVTDHLRIDSDERGFTITKSLAWTMIVALITAALWFGVKLGQVETKLDTLQNQRESFSTEIRREMLTMDTRLRTVERSDAQISQLVRTQTSILERIDSRLTELSRRMTRQEVQDGTRN